MERPSWRIVRAPDGNRGAMWTTRTMFQLAKAGSRTPEVRSTALGLTRHLQPYDVRGEIEALHAFVRDGIRYVLDVHGTETLQSASYTLNHHGGDCDDKAILLAALLLALGHPVRFRLASTSRRPFRQWVHVYPEVELAGRWIPLETTVPGLRVGDSVGFPGPAFPEGASVYLSCQPGVRGLPRGAVQVPTEPRGRQLATRPHEPASPWTRWLPWIVGGGVFWYFTRGR